MEQGAKVKVAIDVDALGDQIAEMSAHIDAAMHRLLTAIREFDIASGWHVQGAMSCAHWLALRVGWDLRTARERVRVARKLAEPPLVDEELRRGAMSYSQARAISRVATADNEKLWVGYAKHMPASQLDTLCRSYQNVQAYDQAHESGTGAMAGAMATARRFCCDASVVVANVDAQGVPLSVGRKTRSISAEIKRALRLRDRTCRFPGCTHSRYVDGHHIEHWANGGKTALSNLVLLCSAHHTLLHEGGCRVQANSSNGWDFFDYRNRLIDALPARTTPNDTAARRGLAALHDAHTALAITANTNASKYTGEPIDYARCIDYLV